MNTFLRALGLIICTITLVNAYPAQTVEQTTQTTSVEMRLLAEYKTEFVERPEVFARDMAQQIIDVYTKQNGRHPIVIYEGSQQQYSSVPHLLHENDPNFRGLDNSNIMSNRETTFTKRVTFPEGDFESIRNVVQSNGFQCLLLPHDVIDIMENSLTTDTYWTLKQPIGDIKAMFPAKVSFSDVERILINQFHMRPDSFGRIGEKAGKDIIFDSSEITSQTTVREILALALPTIRKQAIILLKQTYNFQIMPYREIVEENGKFSKRTTGWTVVAF